MRPMCRFESPHSAQKNCKSSGPSVSSIYILFVCFIYEWDLIYIRFKTTKIRYIGSSWVWTYYIFSEYIKDSLFELRRKYTYNYLFIIIIIIIIIITSGASDYCLRTVRPGK